MAERLVTGGDRDPFLPRLLGALRQANEIDLAVAFVKPSGLDLLFPALSEAMELRGARLRVLTSDYLHVTDSRSGGQRCGWQPCSLWPSGASYVYLRGPNRDSLPGNPLA